MKDKFNFRIIRFLVTKSKQMGLNQDGNYRAISLENLPFLPSCRIFNNDNWNNLAHHKYSNFSLLERPKLLIILKSKKFSTLIRQTGHNKKEKFDWEQKKLYEIVKPQFLHPISKGVISNNMKRSQDTVSITLELLVQKRLLIKLPICEVMSHTELADGYIANYFEFQDYR